MFLRLLTHILFSALIVVSCTLRSPEAQMQKLIGQYNARVITNYQMLLGIGTLYHSNPENYEIKKEYFNRMIISGYASWALHYYLAEPERIKNNEDHKLILFAIRQGNHYDLAKEFLQYLDMPQLRKSVAVADSLKYFNNAIADNQAVTAYDGRAGFFTSLGEQDMANMDINNSLQLDPCGEDALFRKLLILFDRENTKEVIRTLERCPGNGQPDRPEWRQAFYQLAGDIENVTASAESENDKLFRLTNLYLDYGFERLALRKSEKLTELNQDNADYLALHAFVYYRLNNKPMAVKFIDMAESITGQTSRLRTLIEQM